MQSTFLETSAASPALPPPQLARIALVLSAHAGSKLPPALEPLIHRALFDRLAAHAALRDVLAPILPARRAPQSNTYCSLGRSRAGCGRAPPCQPRSARQSHGSACTAASRLPPGTRSIGETMTRLDLRHHLLRRRGSPPWRFSSSRPSSTSSSSLAIMPRAEPAPRVPPPSRSWCPPLFFGHKTTGELVARASAPSSSVAVLDLQSDAGGARRHQDREGLRPGIGRAPAIRRRGRGARCTWSSRASLCRRASRRRGASPSTSAAWSCSAPVARSSCAGARRGHARRLLQDTSAGCF